MQKVETYLLENIKEFAGLIRRRLGDLELRVLRQRRYRTRKE